MRLSRSSPRHSRGAGAAAVALFAALLGARPALAQYTSAHDYAAARACIDRIPTSDYARVVVYAVSTLSDSTLAPAVRRPLLFAADALLQTVGQHARALVRPGGGVAVSSVGAVSTVGATAAPDTLPSGSPVLGDSLHVWRGVGTTGLALTAYRDGHVVWHVPGDSAGDTLGGALLARALAAAQAAGEATFWWPTSDSAAAALDSVHLRFRLVWPSVDRNGKPDLPLVDRPAEPLFSMLQPWMEPVRVTRVIPPRYPDDAKHNGYRGSVLLQFVVDSTGRARAESVRALWPTDAPRLTKEQRVMYDAFVASSRRAVVTWSYSPARVGGCAVAQTVQQPLEYKLAP